MSLPENKTMAQFINIYSQLNKSNLDELKSLYDQNVIFEDPAHCIQGWENLFEYFESLYSNINSCQFVIHSSMSDDSQGFLQWTMTFSHPSLGNGQERYVEGCSRIEFSAGRITYHRDYFDLGEMVYEAVPVLGHVVRHIKTRLGQ